MIVRTSPDFTFDIPGEYCVKLLVTDTNGNSGEDEIVIIVEPEDFIVGDDGPVDEDEDEGEKGGGVSTWVWLMGVLFVIAVVVVLLFFFLKRKDVGDEVSGEDELGRVGKEGINGDEDRTA